MNRRTTFPAARIASRLVALPMGLAMSLAACSTSAPSASGRTATTSKSSTARSPNHVVESQPSPRKTLATSTRFIPVMNQAKKCTEGALPDFPSPIPTPSARMALPPAFLAKARQRRDGRLRHVANDLDALLLAAGYSERAYFRLRARDQTVGFAIVTRLERIQRDGTPYPPRDRFLPVGVKDRFDLVDFLKSLFIAPIGYYRLLVFTVAREPVRADGRKIGEAVAEEWLATGGTRLVGCVAHMPLTDEYGIDALIYEFRHAPEERRAERTARPSGTVSQLRPSKLDPAIHLRRAGILGARR